jgi:hypothetical protein
MAKTNHNKGGSNRKGGQGQTIDKSKRNQGGPRGGGKGNNTNRTVDEAIANADLSNPEEPVRVNPMVPPTAGASTAAVAKQPVITVTSEPAPEEEDPRYVQVAMPAGGLRISGSKLYAPRENRFFRGWTETPPAGFNMESAAPELKILAPKITYDDWKQIVAYHIWSVKTYNAETHISHLLTEAGAYIHFPFHQRITRGAMTVKVDYETEENLEVFAKLREQFGVNSGDWHGTTHNHVHMGAFDSATDKDDETTKQGFHITVGKMAVYPIDIHARIRVKMSAEYDNQGNRVLPANSELVPVKDFGHIIAVPGWDASLPAEVREKLSLHWVTHIKDEGFPEEWKDCITEVKSNYSSHHGGGNYYGGGQGGRYSGGTTYSGHGSSYPSGGAGGVPARPKTIVTGISESMITRNGKPIGTDSATTIDTDVDNNEAINSADWKIPHLFLEVSSRFSLSRYEAISGLQHMINVLPEVGVATHKDIAMTLNSLPQLNKPSDQSRLMIDRMLTLHSDSENKHLRKGAEEALRFIQQTVMYDTKNSPIMGKNAAAIGQYLQSL